MKKCSYINHYFTSSNDAILASPGASKSAIEMESHVFQKAKTKDQYLGFVARLILHVREMRKFHFESAGNLV